MHRRHGSRAVIAAGCTLVLILLAGCTRAGTGTVQPHRPGTDAVVASFNFPESELLAEIYGQALAASGLTVRTELDLGTREMVLPAFQQGLVDVVPEYIGSALQALVPGASGDMSQTAAVEARLDQAVRRWHGDLLAPSPAEDQNGLVVTRLTAARYGLRTISDLARVAGRLAFTAPAECPERPYCLAGLKRVYGLAFASQIPLDAEAERVTALEEHVADVALVFTTSPVLTDPDLVLLRDDRHLQPADNVAPIVSERVLARHGAEVTAALDAVSARLTSQELLFLNWRVSVAGRSPAEEAHGWLVRQGLVGRP